MIEWVALALGATAAAGSALVARAVRRRRRAATNLLVKISKLGERVGAEASVVGRVEAPASISPLTLHPCAAWWCWIAARDGEGWREIGAAVHGEFRLLDSSGELELTASQCRPLRGAGFELRFLPSDWPAPGGSEAHDRLRQVCEAAGVERLEAFGELRFKEAMLPLGASIEATGLVVQSPSERAESYRQGAQGLIALGPLPGGFIELASR